MKPIALPLIRSAIVVAALALAGCLEQDSTVTIGADGKCVVRSEATYARSLVEREVANRVFYEEEEEAEPAPKGAKKAKTLTDQELVAAVKKAFEQHRQQDGPETKLEAIEVKDNKVRIVVSLTYPTPKEMLCSPSSQWGDMGTARTVLDKDEQGKLRLTYTFPDEGRRRRGRHDSLQMLGAMGAKVAYRFVLPGKVLKSSLPNTKDNTTWLEVDGKDAKSVDAIEKLMQSPIAIVFEPGGLTVEGLPLDSEKLLRERYAAMRAADSAGDYTASLPIVDAAPGFAAEATRVILKTQYYFPEGKKLLGDAVSNFSYERPGITVHGKLHTPRGRQFLTLEAVKVLKAVDDKGRQFPLPKGDEEGDYGRYSRMGRRGFGDGEREQTTMELAIALQPPQADAKAIEELACETVATTFGKWKTKAISPVKADPQKKTDLAGVLDGATLVVTKVQHREPRQPKEGRRGGEGNQGEVALSITGPAIVKQLDLQLTLPGIEHMSCNPNSDRSKADGQQTTRTVTLNYYFFGAKGAPNLDQLALEVRLPDEVRRERIRFTLKGLDIF